MTPNPSIHDVLNRLADGVEHLLSVHDCDCRGHEDLRLCLRQAAHFVNRARTDPMEAVTVRKRECEACGTTVVMPHDCPAVERLRAAPVAEPLTPQLTPEEESARHVCSRFNGGSDKHFDGRPYLESLIAHAIRESLNAALLARRPTTETCPKCGAHHGVEAHCSECDALLDSPKEVESGKCRLCRTADRLEANGWNEGPMTGAAVESGAGQDGGGR